MAFTDKQIARLREQLKAAIEADPIQPNKERELRDALRGLVDALDTPQDHPARSGMVERAIAEAKAVL